MEHKRKYIGIPKLRTRMWEVEKLVLEALFSPSMELMYVAPETRG
jgi:hypothetical protein